MPAKSSAKPARRRAPSSSPRSAQRGFVSMAALAGHPVMPTDNVRTFTPKQLGLDLDDELIVDLFAGGGGASHGIERAAGRPVSIAINHDPLAISVHAKNHVQARHYASDVFDVQPREAVRGRPVGLLWGSPDCTFHSRARGGKPFRDRNRARRRRALAGVILKWADQVRPRIIHIENVVEFFQWGPLLADGRPCPDRVGQSFQRWASRLRNLGYEVQWKELSACDYGAPTIRKRLFITARCDGQPIVWPEPTHGSAGSGLLPYRTAADIIDWSLPCPSIFLRKKMHADATLRRVAHGVMRYVVESAQPFVVRIGHTGHGDSGKVRSAHAPLSTVTTKAEHLLIVPTLIQSGYGERPGQAPRVPGLHKPLGTVVNGQKHALVAAFLAKHYTGVVGSDLRNPLGTVTTTDHHSQVEVLLEPVEPVEQVGEGEVSQDVAASDEYLLASNLVKLRGTSNSAATNEPLHTISAQGTHHAHVMSLLRKAGYNIDGDAVFVTIDGVRYVIVDIGLRMLEPHELAAAQGFDPGYVLDLSDEGNPVPKYAQVRLVGNSVSPNVAEALVRANFCAVPAALVRDSRKPRVSRLQKTLEAA